MTEDIAEQIKYNHRNLVGGKIVDYKRINGLSILIIEKTMEFETFYYEVQLSKVQSYNYMPTKLYG